MSVFSTKFVLSIILFNMHSNLRILKSYGESSHSPLTSSTWNSLLPHWCYLLSQSSPSVSNLMGFCYCCQQVLLCLKVICAVYSNIYWKFSTLLCSPPSLLSLSFSPIQYHSRHSSMVSTAACYWGGPGFKSWQGR